MMTSGGVNPVVANPIRAAISAAAVFAAADGFAGTTTLPATASMIPSSFVSSSIQPAAKASSKCARLATTVCELKLGQSVSKKSAQERLERCFTF